MTGLHRKQWFEHGDDAFVMKPPRNYAGPRDVGLLPTPMGCITVRPGDWIITDASGRKSIETDPAILKDLKALSLSNGEQKNL